MNQNQERGTRNWEPRALLVLVLTVAALACAPNPDRERLERTVAATYDKETGRLAEITYDSNDNGAIDIRTYMDGTRILRIEIDKDEDGKIERWEYYDANQRLEKVGFSRANDGIVDAWAYEGPDGRIARVEVSTARDGVIDRWEYYDNDVMLRAAEDVDRNGRPDKWETFVDAAIETVAFDENGDGRPDRRLTYAENGQLVLIESEQDSSGVYTKKVEVPQR